MTDFKHGVWYPIDIAPESNEENPFYFDVWAKHYNNKKRKWESRRFADAWKRVGQINIIYGIDKLQLFEEWEPTHWMPLPNPPEDL